MHPRNPYAKPLDFPALAEAYPSLKAHLNPGRGAIDFKNESSVRCLTEAILHVDFGLSVCLPADRLCPPVPNRLNYVLWIQDVVQAHSTDASVAHGMDIGTGASAIYPLLACKLEPLWTLDATDIDETSLIHARANVQRNQLQDRIVILQSEPNGPIFTPLVEGPRSYHFSMCNPPFYANAEEVAQSAESKALEPNAVCTGASVEMITPGGESAFVRRMVEESLVHRTRCRWYTSMLGKLSSVSEVVECLRIHAITNYAITEFVQGQTRRWAVGWSFTDERLPDSISRVSTSALHSFLPPRNTLVQPLSEGAAPATRLGQVLSSIEEAQIEQKESSDEALFFVQVTQDTWSRAARRQRQRGLVTISGEPMIFSVVLKSGNSPVLQYQWVLGHDRPLFESVCSHISRKMTSP
ncbi:S-adenosyl-L-methionine dependent methyltransferase [Mycena floridula]|nr:S-adenosyl-L-methionine dependent methyltransferase [Mycena floridula]